MTLKSTSKITEEFSNLDIMTWKETSVNKTYPELPDPSLAFHLRMAR